MASPMHMYQETAPDQLEPSERESPTMKEVSKYTDFQEVAGTG